MVWLWILLTFATTTLLVLGVYGIVHDLSKQRSPLPAETGEWNPQDGEAPSRSARVDAWRLWIEQTGMRLTLETLLMVTLGTAAAGAIITLCFVPNIWCVALAFATTMAIPWLLVAAVREQRVQKIRSQLPDALDLMSRMLRAGQTIPQSLRGVADEFEAPIADEFGYCYEQQNLGLPTDTSMHEMARRTGALELRILVVALTVHRQTGGNLSELLDNLAHVIRDRQRIQGQIRSLTADGRMQAAILLALPPLLLAVLTMLNQEYVTILFQFPWLLLGMLGFELLGALWLHRIVSFDF